MQVTSFKELLRQTDEQFHKVVPFNAAKDNLLRMDFTERNTSLNEGVLGDAVKFAGYINERLKSAHCKYGIGGYKENRVVYQQHPLFNNNEEEPRSIHLGIDIWGDAGTLIYAPLNGTVHSFANNDRQGDYGGTIILQHNLSGLVFHSLYGHLSTNSLDGLAKGKKIAKGDLMAILGTAGENGGWPPHLHFQLILDMEGREGDYPGVCKPGEKEKYALNCPDPDLILGMMRYAI